MADIRVTADIIQAAATAAIMAETMIVAGRKSEKLTIKAIRKATRTASAQPSAADVGGTTTDAMARAVMVITVVTAITAATAERTNEATSRVTVKAMIATDAITATDGIGRFLSKLTYV